MQKRNLFILTLVIFLLVIDTDIALAGPGGLIVKGFFKTWWGRLIMLVVAIIFAPLIIYIQLKEYFEVKKNKKILLEVGKVNRDFSWLTLDKNVRNVFSRTYDAWDKGDLEEASSYITPWYWQNQQLVHLNRWKEQNLKNVCSVMNIDKVKPLHLDLTDQENLEGSRIVFSISAKICDYLIHKETKKVMEGSTAFGDEEKIWIMEYTNGQWLLDNIDVGDTSLAYAKLENVIPQTVLSSVK